MKAYQSLQNVSFQGKALKRGKRRGGGCVGFVFCKRVKTNSQVEKGISKGCPSNDDGATAFFQPLQTDTYFFHKSTTWKEIILLRTAWLMGGTECSFLIWQLHFSSLEGVIMMFDHFQWDHNQSLKIKQECCRQGMCILFQISLSFLVEITN